MEIIPVGIYHLPNLNPKNAILISLDCCNHEYAELINNFINRDGIVDFISVSIDDIPVSDGVSEEDMIKDYQINYPQMHFMNEEDADLIVAFVNSYKNKVKQIYLQCSMGISRSPSIAAALSAWLNQSAEPIFNTPYYSIKRTYYHLIEDAINRLENNIVSEKSP
jgi:hypothetical protein